ncbi:hypothetical protein BGZ96_001949 [Linnemannia gamsii]|uniref:F-box domain-containing protein n=1 Tax=Linnemannia gamsii TaxID=64522 RepID=A0ABQ7JLM1_9FUNG|nr:hypothetical protein BGZ96_001949 [Linnemannia gamsii]
MAPSDSVFDILELTQLIADNLSQHDLFFCCLVSRSFSATFTPHLWHSITINRNDAIPKFQSPEGRAGLLRNGHLIRVLRIYDPIALESFVEFGTTCANLVSLDVNHRVHHYTREVIRTTEMLSRGRRKGLIGAGQKQISRPPIFSVVTSSTGSGLFGAPAPSPFGLPRAPLPTGSVFSGASASSKAGFVAPSARVRSHAELQRDGETYLISVLERNPQLEFLVVPSHCLNCEAIVRIAGETLLSLKEFYSDADLWQGLFTINFGLADRNLTCLRMDQGPSSQVAQILTLAPFLKHLMLGGFYASNDNIVKEALLRHAPSLEHLEIATRDISSNILQALFCSAPFLRTLTTMAEDLGYRPHPEVELDALQIIDGPWTCTQLEVFECKILNVPRPDIVDTPLGHNLNLVLPPGPPFGPVTAEDQTPLTGAMLVAQQESHVVQRGVLRQLGRLNHLRVLSLGRGGRDWDHGDYSRLEIRGIRILAVDAYVDRNCLELSLESGLDELRGLQALEELNVYQLAHRIGLAEVQWMAEHWPSLKSIVGLRYSESDIEVAHGEELRTVGILEDSEPEHFRWMRENKPDIELS